MGMGHIQTMKTIDDSLADCSLLDVSEAAKRQHLRCPTFLSSALWNGVLQRSDEALSKALEDVYYMYEGCFGFDHFGSRDFGNFTATLDHADGYGMVIVLTDLKAQDKLGLELPSGDRIEFVM